MNTDPIADLLTRLRNAVKARQTKTIVPHSKMKESILGVMKRRKFIADFKVVKNGNFQEIEVQFNPEFRELNLKRVSKPGQRIYISKGDIKSVHHGYGVAVVSTPNGVMAGDEAKKAGIGGEYICEVW
jgi:small subunit ribosomal protein S8